MWFRRKATIFKRKDDVYFVDVREEDKERAQNIIASHGIIVSVDDDVIGKLGRV